MGAGLGAVHILRDLECDAMILLLFALLWAPEPDIDTAPIPQQMPVVERERWGGFNLFWWLRR